jgi:hypothetical protein
VGVVADDVVEGLRAVNLRCFDVEDREGGRLGRGFIGMRGGRRGMLMLFLIGM